MGSLPGDAQVNHNNRSTLIMNLEPSKLDRIESLLESSARAIQARQEQ